MESAWVQTRDWALPGKVNNTSLGAIAESTLILIEVMLFKNLVNDIQEFINL